MADAPFITYLEVGGGKLFATYSYAVPVKGSGVIIDEKGWRVTAVVFKPQANHVSVQVEPIK